MDDGAKRAAEGVSDFYFLPTDVRETEFVTDPPDDEMWGRIAVGLDGADREWFLSLYDAIRDLARTLLPPGSPVDVATGEMDAAWHDAEAERRAAAVSRLWPSGRWDEVERRLSDGSARGWSSSSQTR